MRQRLIAFDGRAMTVLGEAQAALGAQAGYVDALIALIGDEAEYVGSGATWLLKSFLEKGGALSAQQAQTLISALPERAHWSTQLHTAQCVRFLELTADQAAACKTWLIPGLSHKRPFVRAWSLDALAHLARAHDGHQADFEAALRKATKDPAASVRARARGLGLG